MSEAGKFFLLSCRYNVDTMKTKELAIQCEQSLRDAEATLENSKHRMAILADELNQVIVHKDEEILNNVGAQHAAGHRAPGKPVVKGGLLLKGKTPDHVGSYQIGSLLMTSNCVLIDPATREGCKATDV